MRASLDVRPAGRATSTAAPAGRAGAAARSSARAARATRTAPPTGAPAARQEAGRPGRVSGRWRFALRTSTTRCARFCLGAFFYLGRALEEGDELPFAFEEHASAARPGALRVPAARARVRRVARAARWHGGRTRASRSTSCCASPRRRSSRALTPGPRPTEEQALFRTVLLSLLVATAEGCGGFDWDDVAFERAYAELERSLFGAAHAYAAVAPLVGISVVTRSSSAAGSALRRPRPASSRATGPRRRDCCRPSSAASGPLLRARARARPRRRRGAAGRAGELADAVTALRLATAAPVAAGPVLFERLDWRPFGIRAVLPIAATQPPGEPTRLDGFRGGSRATCSAGSRSRTTIRSSPRRSTAGSSRSSRPSRSGRSSCARRSRRCSGRRGSCAPRCCSARRGRRRALPRRCARSAGGEPASSRAADAVRRALVEALLHGDRAALVASLDEVLLGLRAARLAAHRVAAAAAPELARIRHRSDAKLVRHVRR